MNIAKIAILLKGVFGFTTREYIPGRDITASGNLSHADNGTLIDANHATVAIVLTIQSDALGGWNDGSQVAAYMRGAALVSFSAGAGVTLHTPSGLPAAVQYGTIAAIRVGADEWSLA